MANVLSALQIQQILFAYVEAIAAYTSRFARVCPIRPVQQGEVRVSRGAFGGVANTLAAGATTSVVSDVATFESTFGTAHRYVQHKMPTFKTLDDKALTQMGQALAQVWLKNVDREIGSGIEGLLSAPSARAGTGVGRVGASKNFFDTAKKGLQGEGGEFQYANLVASALGEAALDSALQQLIAWRDDRGLQMNLGRGGNLALVHTAAQQSLATKLTGSNVTDHDLQKNWRSGMFGGGLVPWEFGDPDVSIVVDCDVSPFFYGLAGTPNIEVHSYEAMFTTFLVEYDGAFIVSPYEYGAVALQAD